MTKAVRSFYRPMSKPARSRTGITATRREPSTSDHHPVLDSAHGPVASKDRLAPRRVHPRVRDLAATLERRPAPALDGTWLCVALIAVAAGHYRTQRDPDVMLMATAGAVLALQSLFATILFSGSGGRPISTRAIATTSALAGWAIAAFCLVLASPWWERRGRPRIASVGLGGRDPCGRHRDRVLLLAFPPPPPDDADASPQRSRRSRGSAGSGCGPASRSGPWSRSDGSS